MHFIIPFAGFILLLQAPFGNSQLNCPVPPLSCPNADVNFYLYNRANSPVKITESNAASAPIPSGSKLVVLIHGWKGNKDILPNDVLRQPLLDSGYLVLSVDYGPLATEPCYVQGVQNVNLVGTCTSKIIAGLVGAGKVRLQDIHVIGFSLGAQIAGAAGTSFKQTGKSLPWITGLDPAGPLFSDLIATTKDRLDPSDADFVDVVHTNSFVMGVVLPAGHLDFYINGATIQPGCEFSTNVSCSHVRAPLLYAESVTSNRGFYGQPCTYSAILVNNVCISNFRIGRVLMGLNVDKTARGTYRVETNANPPYAMG